LNNGCEAVLFMGVKQSKVCGGGLVRGESFNYGAGLSAALRVSSKRGSSAT
jgi:hypothetical protein